MEGHNAKTYTLELNLSCLCKGCSVKLGRLDNLLKNTQGVNKHAIDQENYRLSVTGNVDITKLMKAIKKIMNKKAVLVKEEDGGSGHDRPQNQAESSIHRQNSDDRPPEDIISEDGSVYYSPTSSMFVQQPAPSLPAYHHEMPPPLPAYYYRGVMPNPRPPAPPCGHYCAYY